MMKRTLKALAGAALCASMLQGEAPLSNENEREFTNLTLGAWTLRLTACRPGGGMVVLSCEREVARLVEPGAAFAFPTQEGVGIRYLSGGDIRFTLEDRTGCDGGVVFQVGRDLALTPLGGDPEALDEVLDVLRLRSGHVDVLAGAWPGH